MSETKHPSTIVNVEGNNAPYRECAYIERLCDATESVGIWGDPNPGARYQNAIAGRNGSRKHPSLIRGSKFNFSISDTAKVTSIIVEYRYRKLSYSSQTAHGSFGNPVIRLPSLNLQKEGNAPPRNTFQTYTVRFDGLNLRGSDVKSDNFTVDFDLPPNTSTNPCYIEIQYLRVTIEFASENYTLYCNILEDEIQYGEVGSIICKTNDTSGLGGNKTLDLHVDIPDDLSLVDKPEWLNFDGTLHQNLTNGLGITVIQFSPANQYVQGVKEVTFSNPQTGHVSKDQVRIKSLGIELWDFYLNNKEITVSNDTEKYYTYLYVTLRSPFPRTASLDFDYAGLIANKEETIYIDEEDWGEDDSGNFIYDVGIQLYSTELGLKTVSMTSNDFYGVYTAQVQVNLSENAAPYYTSFYLQDFTYMNMIDGKKYVFSCLARLSGADEVVQGSKNNRVGLKNGTSEVYSKRLSQVGEWEELKIEFVYDAENPILITCYGNYLELDEGNCDFANFCLIDYEFYNGYEYPVIAITPLTNLLQNNGEYGSCLLEPPDKILTTRHYFKLFDWQGLDTSKAVLIHGVEVSGDISSETPINVILGFGTTEMSENDYYRDSLHVTESDTEFKFGGKFRTLGQEFYEIQGNMSDWRFWLQFDHSSGENTPNLLNVKNVIVKVYYTINSEQECDFYIDGTDARYYLISMNPETEIPRGAQYDSETYKVEGADGEYPVRINIEQKEIGLKFFVYGDDFEDSTELLSYITEFLYPLRNNLDDPVLKSISFYFDREHCYDYYIEDEIEAEAVVGGYECEVLLLIPDGLKRTIEKVHRGYTGDTSSIGKIRPEIEFIKQQDSEDGFIEIVEEYSGQKLRLTGEFIEGLEDGTRLKIDCKNKKAYYLLYDEWFLLDSNFISIESNWFILNGLYNFEYCTNCKVTDIYFYEYTG